MTQSATQSVTQLKPAPTKAKFNQPAPFQFATKNVPCKHKAQITLDYGNVPGPHVIIGMNEKAYCFGYLPKNKKK